MSALAQVTSALGALLVLGGYVLLQARVLNREDALFNALNFAGSALLGVCAVIDRRWGFIVLETVWALVSLGALLRSVRKT